jgi:ring-1,2-phenylacetyl-CoA epoxidase subunit PaaE
MSLTADVTPRTGLRFHPLRVAEVRRETPSAVSVAFEVPAALREAFAFRPGQYLTLRTRIDGEEIRRCYSICVPPDAGELRVAIKHVEGGVFSSFANTRLAAGDVLDVLPPEGRFAADAGAGDGRRHLAIAAGSGITPILSILARALAREPASEALLLYGSRSTPEILFRDALEDLKDRHLDRLALVHVLSREEQDLGVFAGRLDAERISHLVRGWAEPGAIDAAYVCGPEGLIATAEATLPALGVREGRVHVERFVLAGEVRRAATVPVAAGAPEFAHARVIHDGKTTEVPIAEGEAVLEAALRAGLDLPWSCRAGMCCTCRARLVEGTAEMRQNFSLQPWEMEAGFVLTCQAVPTSERLVLDYDAA